MRGEGREGRCVCQTIQPTGSAVVFLLGSRKFSYSRLNKRFKKIAYQAINTGKRQS